MRPLSPSQFVDEVGGELTDIARYFRQLAKLGYIKLIETRPGRRRGVAIEHVYEGVQQAYFDTPSWEGVPRSDRDAVSRAAVNSYFSRVSEAVSSRTFDEEVDRHLSWDRVVLDRSAWRQLGGRLDQVLASLSSFTAEATERLSPSFHQERIPAIISLAAFRSPQSPATMLQASRRHEAPAVTGHAEPFVFGPKLAKALSNQWRCRILMELTLRPMSPSQFVEEIGGSKSHISRCFRELADWGYVEVFEERRGGRLRGGVELIYRNSQMTYFDTPTWVRLPRLIREDMSQAFLHSYSDRVNEALEADTFDMEVDRHFSWTPLFLDRMSWNQIGELLNDILAWLPRLEAESLERTEDHLDEMIPTIVGLASFRSPEQPD